jgi:hypothetical protein
MLIGLDLPVIPAGLVEMNRIGIMILSRFDDLDAELFLPAFQIFSSPINLGVAHHPDIA